MLKNTTLGEINIRESGAHYDKIENSVEGRSFEVMKKSWKYLKMILWLTIPRWNVALKKGKWG